MKVEVKENETKKELGFPCLMKSEETGLLVLFYAYRKGVVLSLGEKETSWKVGELNNEFYMANFKPFKGSITLSND
jgi:hypothetical protein